MNRIVVAGVALALVTLAGCGKQEDPAPTPPIPVPPSSAPVAPAPPPQAVGESCSLQCGATTISIQCAEGETPVCDCAVSPPASCKVPAAS
jgi:hypothetical protein